MGGQVLSDTNNDKGNRKRVGTVDGALLRRWDDRNQIFRAEYDDLRRLTHLWVTVDDLEDEEDTPVTTLLERRYYGESIAAPEDTNVRGRLVHAYDGAGLVISDDFDFKGNPLSTARRLFDRSGGDQVPDWISVDEVTDPLAAATTAPIEAETFTASAEFDALNRVTTATAPNGAETVYEYDLGGALFSATVDTVAIVEEIHYDAHGRRETIQCGNGVETAYEYDPLTFRLARLVSTRASDSAKLQDLRYTLDPVGNVLSMADDVTPAVYFDDNYVDASTEYRYDPLYRLVEASGREHGSNAVPIQSDDGRFITSLPDPNDPQALRRYTEEYDYDGVSNIVEMRHTMVGNTLGNWTRTYSYTSGTNRLASTTANSDPSITYSHDDHGNVVAWPHLPTVEFTPLDQMWHAELPSGDAYYYYDSGGNRVRKVIVNGSPKKERIYLGGFEYYRETTTALDFERTTLHVMDGARRVCMIETKTIEDEDPVTPLVPMFRYQLVNHLETGVVECDENGAVFSFEEYSPYGVTMYQSRDTGVEVSAKRYRYAAAERDDETGFYSMGARYYCPWLGRWTTADPLGLQAGINVYLYATAGPVTLSDPSGLSTTQGVIDQEHAAELEGNLKAQMIHQMNEAMHAAEDFLRNHQSHGFALDALEGFATAGKNFVGGIFKAETYTSLPGKLADIYNKGGGGFGGVVDVFNQFNPYYQIATGVVEAGKAIASGDGKALGEATFSTATGVLAARSLSKSLLEKVPKATALLRGVLTNTGEAVESAGRAGVRVAARAGVAAEEPLASVVPKTGATPPSGGAAPTGAASPLAGATEAEIDAALGAPPSGGPMFQLPAPTAARFNKTANMMTNDFKFRSKTSMPGASGDVATQLRVHTADPTAPPGSNSASGPTASLMQAKGGRRFVPGEGFVSIENATPDQLNRSHIPLFPP
ncbi:MAG: RHS repeat-associated core domain-containing protein [Polyangiaceae bacterium]